MDSSEDMVTDCRMKHWKALLPLVFFLLTWNVTPAEKRILLIGGFNRDQYYDQVFSTSADSLIGREKRAWTAEPRLPRAVQGHTAVTLGDRLYVIGGFEGFARDRSPLFSRDLFTARVMDGRIGDWSFIGSLPHPLAYHGAVTFQGGIILSGGQSPADVSAVYVSRAGPDGSLTGWKKAADLPRAMRGHAAVMAGNRMFILGGHDNRACFDDVFSAEVSEDGRIGEWVHTMPLPRALIHFGVSEYNGRIYVFGGQDRNWKLRREVFSATVSASELSPWRRERSLATPLARMGVLRLNGAFLLAGGGYGWDAPVYADLWSSVIAERGELRKWRKVGKLPAASAFHTVLPLPDSLSPSAGCAGLEGLSADRFFEESYRSLLLRYPETVSSKGLSAILGLGNDRLDDHSERYLRETQELERGILRQLRALDRSRLSPSEGLTADVYRWYLEDLVRAQPFADNNYPLNPGMYSAHRGLIQLFVSPRPFQHRQDALDHLDRLSRVKIWCEQLADGMRRRERIQAVLPRFFIGLVRRDIEPFAKGKAMEAPFYLAFKGKLEALYPRGGQERDRLLAEAEQRISGSVIPGCRLLLRCLDSQYSTADDRIGIWKQYRGAEAYAHLLRHHTSSELDAREIQKIGEAALKRIHAEMRRGFAALGYDAQKSLPFLYRRLARDDGMVPASQVVLAFEKIIGTAEGKVSALFGRKPKAEVVVAGSPLGGAYLSPAADGSRPGIFYTYDRGDIPRFSMASLAYHEAVPGHHYQMALSQELDLPLFRRDVVFTAFTEGWALYAERLAKEIGLYDGDPQGDLGRLQYEAYRAARLVVDTGIHARRWNFERAVNFMVRNTGMSRSSMQGEVIRYSLDPGQAAAYYIGFMKILELRERARFALGDRFDLREFHDLLLGSGALPLPLLEEVVDGFVAQKNKSGGSALRMKNGMLPSGLKGSLRD